MERVFSHWNVVLGRQRFHSTDHIWENAVLLEIGDAIYGIKNHGGICCHNARGHVQTGNPNSQTEGYVKQFPV